MTLATSSPTNLYPLSVMTLAEEGVVSFHVHSRFPWIQTADGWVTRGERAELLVRPQWQPIGQSGIEDFVDGPGRPVYHLTLRASAARAHRLVTVLRVRPLRPDGPARVGDG